MLDVCFVIALSLCMMTLAVSADARSGTRPAAEHLLTEALENPLGIDAPEPRFSWWFVQDVRGARQSAYQVQVADDLVLLESGRPNVWDSGRARSGETLGIPLKDKVLSSGRRYYWRVKVWDASGIEGDWSKPAWFETGLLVKSDWTGVWLNSPSGGNGYHSDLTPERDTTKWVQVDLGQPTGFTAVKLYPAQPHNWDADTPGFGFPVRYRLEASDDAEFSKPIILADRTQEDQPNLGAEPVTIAFDPVTARYVRLVATRLYTRSDWQKLFALAEMEVLDAQGRDLARRKPVAALDSIEKHGWSREMLTDGLLQSVKTLSSAPVFRHEFDLGKAVKRARAYVVGLGYCELHLNGKKVGDRVLDPAFTNFPERALYSTYDVTDQLATGRNAVGVILGKGWFGESPKFILQMNVEFADGTCTSITTNKDWKRSTSPIQRNSLYHGETYDARLEQSGWDSPGFDASAWEPAETVTSPAKTLSAEMIQPIRVCTTIKPRKLTNPKPGIWVYDFRQNFSGWCRLKVSGPAGTEVSIRHAEVLYDDGTINQENLRSAQATDRYILKGEGVETYEPRFTYHGFRYVQIEGFPGTPELSTLTGCVVHTDLAQHGSFKCSNPLINRIYRNACWGYKTNWHSIPTDCPQRDERQGWMGDAHMTADMGLYSFDVGPAYTKWLRDMEDTQGEDGRVPDSVPYIGHWGSNPGDPMWASAYEFINWDMYRHTGDRRLLARHYPGIKKYVDMLAREAKDYIIERNNYGDWVGIVETPRDLISTGAFYRCSWMVARMAEILGQPNDAKKYDDLCAKIAVAFNARFFDPKTNNYGNGSQYSNAWPLYLGIVPAEKHDAVVKNLVEDITVKHKGHLSTGFPGARYLPEVLCNEGRPDVAYTIVTQKDYPGWGYMISKGATTIWELWRYEVGPHMNSHNHPAFGFVGGWFIQALAGITPNAEHGGFEGFDIKPFVVGDLTEARASVDTVRGPVASHWARTNDGITLNVTIPGNSTASVWVPKVGLSGFGIREGRNPVWKNGRFVPGVAGISGASDAGDWIRFDCGAGTYSFRLMSDE